MIAVVGGSSANKNAITRGASTPTPRRESYESVIKLSHEEDKICHPNFCDTGPGINSRIS